MCLDAHSITLSRYHIRNIHQMWLTYHPANIYILTEYIKHNNQNNTIYIYIKTMYNVGYKRLCEGKFIKESNKVCFLI